MDQATALSLKVSAAGLTCYAFATENFCPKTLLLKDSKFSSLGIYSLDELPTSKVSCTNVAVAVVSVGPHRERICANCYNACISGKVKQQEGCRNLSFCSLQCLRAEAELIDICGNLLDNLASFKIDPRLGVLRSEQPTQGTKPMKGSNKGDGICDIMRLAIAALYNCNYLANDHGNTFHRILALEHHPNKPLEHITLKATEFLHAKIREVAPSLLKCVDDYISERRGKVDMCTLMQKPSVRGSTYHFSDGTTEVLYRLIRVIQFNAQPLPVPGLGSGTALLALLPLFARLNHSCIPNAAIAYRVTRKPISCRQRGRVINDNDSRENALIEPDNAKDSVPQVVASLIALRDIAAGEELCISYLNNLCVPAVTRRALLSEAFLFQCNCARCRAEVEVGGGDDFVGEEVLTGDNHCDSIAVRVLRGLVERCAAAGPSIPIELMMQVLTVAAEISDTFPLKRPPHPDNTAKVPASASAPTSTTPPSAPAPAPASSSGCCQREEIRRALLDFTAVYLVHDAATLLLQSAMQLKKTPANTTGASTVVNPKDSNKGIEATTTVPRAISTTVNTHTSDNSRVEEIDLLSSRWWEGLEVLLVSDVVLVRSVALLSACWTTIGCPRSSASLTDYKLAAVVSGRRIGQYLLDNIDTKKLPTAIGRMDRDSSRRNKHNDQHSDSDTNSSSSRHLKVLQGSFELAKQIAVDTIELLRLHYQSPSFTPAVDDALENKPPPDTTDSMLSYFLKSTELCSRTIKMVL